MRKNNLGLLRPMFILFVFLSAFFISGKNILVKWNIDQDVLIMGNLLLLIITLGSYLILSRATRSANPNSFVRAMYGSFIIKFFVIAATAFIYIVIAKKNVNKPGLIACMGLYVIYTVIEVSALTKLLKQKKNA